MFGAATYKGFPLGVDPSNATAKKINAAKAKIDAIIAERQSEVQFIPLVMQLLQTEEDDAVATCENSFATTDALLSPASAASPRVTKVGRLAKLGAKRIRARIREACSCADPIVCPECIRNCAAIEE